MNPKIIQQIGRSQRISIINLLKRSEGMAVADMSEKLGMSYMGVKQHCLSLHRQGYLTTKRSPQSNGKIGRPEMLYLLTPKASDLFTQGANPVTISVLEAAQSLYGATAPEKLLFKFYQNEAERYGSKVKGETLPEKIKAFVKVRDGEGYLSDAVNDQNHWKVVEHHSPMIDLLEIYPNIGKMEEDLFQKVLGVSVKRTAKKEAGQYLGEFTITE